MFAVTRISSRKVRMLCSALVLFTGFLVAGPSVYAQPNFLFIFIDDLNDYIGVLGGHPQAYTPNIDALANEGVLFTNAHVAGPSCNAARTSLLTGITPARSGVVSNDTVPMRDYLPEAVSLIRAFHDHGYSTIGFGKIFHQFQSELADWDTFAYGYSGTPTGSGLFYPRLNGLDLYGQFDWGAIDWADSEMDDYQNTSRAIDFLNNRLPDDPQPFFLALGIIRPHLPWYCPTSYHELIAQGNTSNIVLPPMLDGDLDDVGPIARRWATSLSDHEDIVAAGLHRVALHA